MRNFKWYRKLIGGIWYKISYTEKRNGGMDRVNRTFWWYADIDWYKQYSNFKIIETENYENK